MDSSNGLNVGDVTGPRWAGGTRNPDDAEKAWEERERFFAENGYPEQTDYHRGVSYIGFKAGWKARDAEVDALREQLAAAEAVIARVYKMALEDDAAAWDSHQALVQLVCDPDEGLPVLAARDREVAERALEPIRAAEAEWRRTPMERADVHFRSQVFAALRSGTEGSTDV